MEFARYVLPGLQQCKHQLYTIPFSFFAVHRLVVHRLVVFFGVHPLVVHRLVSHGPRPDKL